MIDYALTEDPLDLCWLVPEMMCYPLQDWSESRDETLVIVHKRLKFQHL